MKSSLLASTTLLAAVLWTVALVADGGPLEASPVLLVGIGLLVTSTVATVGMIVVGGRWAHRLGLASLTMTAVVALVRDIDVFWMAAMVATAVGLVAIFSPILTDTIRQLPSASGPPPRAVAPALLLLVAPFLIGLVGNDAVPWALLLIGLAAPVVALVYSRVLPGGLITVRLGWPMLAIAMSPLFGWVAGTVTTVVALAVAALAWDPSVKASYHPPREVGSTFPIPPELTPKEVLDAAEIDDKGRRK